MKSSSLFLTVSLLSASTLATKNKPTRYISYCHCANTQDTDILCDKVASGADVDANIGLTSQGVFREFSFDPVLYYNPATVKKTHRGGNRVCQMDLAESSEYLTVTLKDLFIANRGGDACDGLTCRDGKLKDTRA